MAGVNSILMTENPILLTCDASSTKRSRALITLSKGRRDAFIEMRILQNRNSAHRFFSDEKEKKSENRQEFKKNVGKLYETGKGI